MPWQKVNLQDIEDPQGFQHAAQTVFVSDKGFYAVVVTAHLSWTHTVLREQEKALLGDVVTRMLQIDPDVIITGDFNTGIATSAPTRS